LSWRKFCIAVFERRPEAASSCFAGIASPGGILDFLKFGRAICDVRKDAIKLLLLLAVLI
ncbi:Os02g0231850, partial [Oryza sativa Japonica Group]